MQYVWCPRNRRGNLDIENTMFEDTEKTATYKPRDRPQKKSTLQNLDLRLLDSRTVRLYFK